MKKSSSLSSEAEASEQLHFVGTRSHRAARSSSTRTCSIRREPARHASSARCASVSTVSGKLGCHLGRRGTWYVQWQYRCQLPCAPRAYSSAGDRLVLVVRTVRKSVGRTCQHRVPQHEQPSTVGLSRVVVEEAV